MDPNNKLRTVDYIADKQGFHPFLNEEPPAHPSDSEAVARAKDRHYQLYNKIAEEHQQHPYSSAGEFIFYYGYVGLLWLYCDGWLE